LSSNTLTPTSYQVLVLVGRGGAGAHDLVRMARSGRVYAASAESQYYAESKRLARLGYLSARKVPGKTRERTYYELTEKGLEALREWVRTTTPSPPQVATDAIVRLLAADLVGEPAVLEGLSGLRGEIEDLLERVSVTPDVAETLPHRRKYLLLNYKLARAVLEAHLAWLDDVERELDEMHPPRRASRRRRK
jgi:DNA-binding PadR family transcriptional regulator